jgi:hypothetical protein
LEVPWRIKLVYLGHHALQKNQVKFLLRDLFWHQPCLFEELNKIFRRDKFASGVPFLAKVACEVEEEFEEGHFQFYFKVNSSYLSSYPYIKSNNVHHAILEKYQTSWPSSGLRLIGRVFRLNH